MQVLEHEPKRLRAREGAGELDDGLVRLPLHRVTGEPKQALLLLLLEHEPEERREERVPRIGAFAEYRLELGLQFEPDAGLRIADSEPEKAAKQLAHRVVGHVLRI